MGVRTRGDVPADLAKARERFLAWRRTKQPRGRIPQRLWKLVVKLAETHGLYRTASVLKLDYYSLKKQVEQASDDSESFGAVFVFRNRCGTAIKVLVYDGQGFWLCHKKQEEQSPSSFAVPEFGFASHNCRFGTYGLGFLVREAPRDGSRRRSMERNASVPPPRQDRRNVPLTQFWARLDQQQRERTLATLSRVVAKQLAPPPVEEEVDDD